ncbi:MAG: glycosyl hydrolase family 65 protein, partial [Planctomycetota bacterium]
YAEPVLVDPRADAAHPAFQNLFVQTRLVRGRQAILARRRARSADERTPYVVHLMTCYGLEVGETQYETDRNAFIGRGRDLASPSAMRTESLTGGSGSVLDPCLSIRRTVRLRPGEKCRLDVVTGVADNSEAAHGLIEKYHDRRLCDRVSELAWTHSQVVLRQLGIDEADAQAYGRLAGSVIYATPQRRASAEVIARNAQLNRKQSNLWAYGISGDLPIVLLRVGDHEKVRLVGETVRAHAYWRRKGLKCDLVIWNEDQSGYRAEVNDAIQAAVAKAGSGNLLDQPGGIFVRRSDQFPEEDKVLLQAVARVTLTDKAGELAEQIDRRMAVEPAGIAKLVPQVPRSGSVGQLLGLREVPTASEITPRDDLLFHNGTGGFTRDGKEYVVTHDADTPTPAPWSNVIANPKLGTLVSEAGASYTWRTNAREFRLTPFHNDPVSDKSGEALYLRDDETGRFWSPTGLPARGVNPVTTRHGFGYSVFESSDVGLRAETTLFVHRDEPVKLLIVRVQNQSERRRSTSLWYFAEWCLADQRPGHAMHVITRVDAATGGILARNPYNAEFGRETAFVQCSESQRTVTGDRLEFLGRNGRLAEPAALKRERLSNKVGAGLDPCAAMCVPVELGPGEEKEIVFALGAGDDEEHAKAMCARFTGVAESRRALEDVWQHWGRTLGTLYVETPDPAVNVLANGWLEYQALACRYWGRSGYYQSGGAYGFRDQLQDVAALLWCEPSLIREHLLRAAERQFREGDVLHWWHPPGGKGVRTNFSDDYMWLPLVAARYVAATGDVGVLDEDLSFLQGPHVPHGEESIYQEWVNADERADLYEHCRRAILNGIERRGYGPHGLPLMGCGDWNDGMNLVGEHGRGESVWLAWFFIDTLHDFAGVAELRSDDAFAKRCRDEAETLRQNAEREAWDGAWYRRAWFDDGTPLGSAQNPECQIDSLPQSWGILSGAADEHRAAMGMQAVEERLVRRDKGLIQLFDPPFDNSNLEPGYIKGYVPGVRENGGQYTHAAVWTIMAYAKLGDARRAWELFDLINPVNHADTPEAVQTYRVEPYVVAADVYGVEPHVGRGGWTWYTGSAGWMFRLVVESLLGLKLRFVDGRHELHLSPLLPEGWDGFNFNYRHRNTHHQVRVTRTTPEARRVASITVDGEAIDGDVIPLQEDQQPHEIIVELGD